MDKSMLLEKLQNSLRDAFQECISSNYSKPRLFHAARSKAWVKNIAASFREEYVQTEYRVFSADYSDNRSEFKLNELLFDISVVNVKSIPSASNKKQLIYVNKMEWAIESEFQRSDSRASIIDFSKLAMARSENKLLILSQSKSIKNWALSILSGAVPEDGDNYFLAFVPHPESWDEDMKVELYSHGKDGWEARS
ncbi:MULTISPECIES: hypothetical protein [Shewanella]|nr:MULTISPECIES: hypothetical protein [Shewanella]MCU8029606.1 hypothetical protein [Shewanella sp. SM73]